MINSQSYLLRVKIMIDKEKIKNLYINKEYETVTDIVDKLLLKNRKDTFLLTVRGMIHSQKEEFNESIKYFQECLLIDINNDNIYSNLAFSFLSINDHDRAIENFEKAIAINNDSFKNHSELGNLYLKKGNIIKAKISLEKALSLDDSKIQVYQNLSACYL